MSRLSLARLRRMGEPMVSRVLAASLAAGLVLAPASMQTHAAAEPAPAEGGAPSVAGLSPQCRAPGADLYTLAPLRRTKAALKQRRAIKVLAFGSSSTAGIGASSPQASYPVRLEHELEQIFGGLDFRVANLGLSGELAAGTAERIKAVVSASPPDLVVWQVGTNDALAGVDTASFAATLQTTLRWLKERRIDVVLVDPQYTPQLGRDQRCSQLVQVIGQTARQNGVPVVRRYDSMQQLTSQRPGADRMYLSADRLHLNDLGYRCMAEHAARAIALSLVRDE